MLKLCDGHDIDDCREHFLYSAREAFKPRRFLRLFKENGWPWLYSGLLALTLLITDSKYPSGNLDSLLQAEYGLRRSIMDWSPATEMGISLGFTLTRVGGTKKTVIATNYNGVGDDHMSPGNFVLPLLYAET
jgi:hypothetical protein